MPSITDIKNIKKPSRLFEKREYRPWSDSSDSSTLGISQNINKPVIEPNVHTPYELEKIWRYLYGAKKVLLKEVINNIEEKCSDHVITSALNARQLSTNTSLPINTIRSAVQRLKQDGIIFYYEKKPGRGGFARYLIPVAIHSFFQKKFSQDK
jgi:hypothetical protein